MSFLARTFSIDKKPVTLLRYEEEEPEVTQVSRNNGPDGDFFNVETQVQKGTSKSIVKRKLLINTSGITVLTPDGKETITFFPFECIKAFVYGDEGDFLVIHYTDHNGSNQVDLWRSNKQAEAMKKSVNSRIKQRMQQAEEAKKMWDEIKQEAKPKQEQAPPTPASPVPTTSNQLIFDVDDWDPFNIKSTPTSPPPSQPAFNPFLSSPTTNNNIDDWDPFGTNQKPNNNFFF